MPRSILSVSPLTALDDRAETTFRPVPLCPAGLGIAVTTIPARAVGVKNTTRTSTVKPCDSCCDMTTAMGVWLWQDFLLPPNVT